MFIVVFLQKDLPCLEDLCFVNNPLGEGWWTESPDIYTSNITKALGKLKRLDGMYFYCSHFRIYEPQHVISNNVAF